MSPTPLQWSVFSVDLDPTVGSEQAGRRPVLVVSRESANRVLPVVSAIPLTTRRPERQVYPNEALIPRGHAGLNRDSIAMAHQPISSEPCRRRASVRTSASSTIRASAAMCAPQCGLSSTSTESGAGPE